MRLLSVLKNFKDFMLRGNVIDLSVAVVMGAAFGAVVNALVKDLLTPLTAAIFGKPDFSKLTFELNGSKFFYGDFVDVLIPFLLIGISVYFAVVLPMNAFTARLQRGQTPLPPRRSSARSA